MSDHPAQIGAFMSQFHVRRGNEIACRLPHDLDVDRLEWKTLPSGGHLIERDTLLFEHPSKSDLIGIAAFRNIKLSAQANNDGAHASQRGARMFSVSVLLRPDSTLSQEQLQQVYLHHSRLLDALAHAVAEIIRLQDRNLDLAESQAFINVSAERLDAANSGSSASPAEQIAQLLTDFSKAQQPSSGGAISSKSKRLPSQAPLLLLPSEHHTFGPMLTKLVKLVLPPYMHRTARRRILIYSPAGSSIEGALMVASNVLRLAEEATAQKSAHSRTLRLLGYVSLHDLTDLEAASKSKPDDSWVAVTSDRILLDKTVIFDVLVDLSNVGPDSLESSADLYGSPAAAPEDRGLFRKSIMPSISLVSPAPSGKSRKATLEKVAWTSKEFSAWFTVDEMADIQQEQWYEERRARRKSHSRLASSPAPDPVEPGEAEEVMPGSLPLDTDSLTSRHGTLTTFFTFLHYCLGDWGWLPNLRWFPYMGLSVIPLGIRGDGGVRTSMLLTDDLSDDEEDEGEVDGRPSAPRDIPSRDEEDPLVAASGGYSLSRSPLSTTRRRSVVLEAAEETDANQRLAPSSTVDASYALAIWTAWVNWTTDLIENTEELIKSKVQLELREEAITLTAWELHKLGLSSRVSLDVELVTAIAASSSHAITVRSGWTSKLLNL